MKTHSWYLVLFVLSALFSTPLSFSFKQLVKQKDVEGVDLTVKDGYGKASAIDPNGAASAVAEGLAAVTGKLAAATGQSAGVGTGTTADGPITAFATTKTRKIKVLGLNFGYAHVKAGFKGDKNDSSSSEEVQKETKTLFSVGFDWKNKTKSFTEVLPFK